MAAERSGGATRRLDGKRVLVTGGSSGIGRAIVLEFAAAGAHVVAAARRTELLEEVRRAAPPGSVGVLTADVSVPQQSRRMVSEAIDLLGGLDVLVNNAGIAYMEPFLELTEEHWAETLDTNLNGAFFASQVAARHMVGAGGGSIINIASIDSFVVEAPAAHYMASKAALAHLTKCVAFELGHLGVRCNAVCPGFTKTPMNAEGFDQALWESYLRRIPMRRLAEPREQAAVVLFLASEDASYVNGETILVDGGQLSGFWYRPEHEPPVPRYEPLAER